jgi:hypothetical protein
LELGRFFFNSRTAWHALLSFRCSCDLVIVLERES